MATEMEAGILALILGGGLVILALRLSRATRARRIAREGYFDLIAPHMTGLRRAVMPTGFARISGLIGGQLTDLQLIPDTLTWRKLPTLWLLVTQPGALPVSQRIDLMVRPRGIEPFSTFDTLPHQTILPQDFPFDACLRSETPLSPGEAALLQRHQHLLQDPRIKELIIAPEGLRLTFFADQAERGRYLIFREAEMGRDPLEPETLAPLLGALADLRADILAGASDKDARKSA
ncbi:hypothetical protein M3484_04815 [Pseudomonas sp. GX19020]|uniref:hypothetical protein n=1 Tax=Pseudomonas sp. GX19020 TaxID=2942277 RepID=UPI0020187CBB|nr:hypothetical protein [Pseudomonas sp. GX19020]MCL4065884.1 hypothetical protein [Pseudomonas sp. GX19020]